MLILKQLDFHYSSDLPILNGINFQIEKGQFLTILGESGSGKSTLLKLIYGLEDAIHGQILFEGNPVLGPKHNLIPGHKEMKFVPQEFDLLDYVTVAENVGKYLSNFDIPLKKETIQNALKVVNMDKFQHEFPTNLSGGQRQRVAIARALAAEPKLLLLDEPYSHLDQPLKFALRKNIWNWAKQTRCTVLLTTHDANDALGFSDQIMVMKNGKILQMDAPENLRNNPLNQYVVSLLGPYSILNSEQMKNYFDKEIPDGKQAILYPEEIVESLNGVVFQISDIRFQGRDYLVEAKKGEVKLVFYMKAKPQQDSISVQLNNFRLI